MKTLLIDNYDSYTYNLYQLLAKVNGEAPTVVANDAVDWGQVKNADYDNIVISPGPGHPGKEADFGVCARVLAEAKVPVLGVCLGHQGMAEVFGGRVIHAPEAIHGRRSGVLHTDSDVFSGIPQGFQVVRYHSLVVDPETLPDCLVKTAWTEDGIIMGLRHQDRPIWGVQFHPESISTEYGSVILDNFRQLTEAWQQEHGKEKGANVLDGYSTIPASGETPESRRYAVHVRKIGWQDPEQVFSTLYKDRTYAFWLDSSRAEPGMARFSFIGSNDGHMSKVIRYDVTSGLLEVEQADRTETCEMSIFDYLDQELKTMYTETDLPFDFNTGFCGYFGYELKAESGGDPVHQSPIPDACFILASRLLAFDHETREVYLLELAESGEQESGWFDSIEQALAAMPELETLQPAGVTDPVPFELFRSHDEYIKDIEKIKQEIIDGETYEITLTNEISVRSGLDPFLLYRHLRALNPAPYAAYLSLGGLHVLSSSPERFLKMDKSRHVSAKPIKGTIKRGADEAEDKKLLDELKYSEKNRAENLMIVDLLRNDLGLVCEVGSVDVPKLMDVETYETVHQLVSTITGTLRRGMTAAELVRAAFAGGSMTGAPKKRSMQIIDEVEGRPRGIYSGSIGFLGLNGTADLNIVIRTIIKEGERLSIGAGGAITMLSDAEEEYEEMLLKAQALLHAIAEAESASFATN